MLSYKESAKLFCKERPYATGQYKSRNWGHNWHSLCSYHGKLKPSIAHFLIKNFTSKGERILDPLSGVGTIPLEARLQNRIAIGNDLSKFAAIVTRAKLESVDYGSIKNVLEEISELLEIEIEKKSSLEFEDFGLNKNISDYFERNTLREILILRKYFKDIDNMNANQAFVFSCFLHVLHGNRPYALSRRSHPLTPYAPQGEFIYKNVIQSIWDKVNRSFCELDKDSSPAGLSLNMDYNNLNYSLIGGKVDAIITSPPFVGTFKFYSQNWLRLWLTGWEKEDFANVSDNYLELETVSSLKSYESFFSKMHELLEDRGRMILHLGKSQRCDMGRELLPMLQDFFIVEHFGEEDVSGLERHGIRDKGGTMAHQFVFLTKRKF